MKRLYIGSWCNLLKAYQPISDRREVPHANIIKTPQSLEEAFIYHTQWVCTHPTLFDKESQEYLTGDLIQLMCYNGFLMRPSELKNYISGIYFKVKIIASKHKVTLDILTNPSQCYFKFSIGERKIST